MLLELLINHRLGFRICDQSLTTAIMMSQKAFNVFSVSSTREEKNVPSAC